MVTLALQPNGDRKHRTIISPHSGKPSTTRLHVLERFRAYTLIEAVPETGRTHQIRAHLAASGFPIAGDTLYGRGAETYYPRGITGYTKGDLPERAMLERLALHARSLSFKHPISGDHLKFEAPYPDDFENTMRQLRKFK